MIYTDDPHALVYTADDLRDAIDAERDAVIEYLESRKGSWTYAIRDGIAGLRSGRHRA